MADIPSPATYTKMNDQEIDAEKPLVTELFNKIGGQINKLIDDTLTYESTVGALSTFVYLRANYASAYDGSANRTYVDFPAIVNTRFLCNLIYVVNGSVSLWHTATKRLERVVTTGSGDTVTIIDDPFHSSSPDQGSNSWPYIDPTNPLTSDRTMLFLDFISSVPNYISTTYRISWAGNNPQTIAAIGLIQSL